MNMRSVEDERKPRDESDVCKLRNWNNAFHKDDNLKGEIIDLWEASDLYLSYVEFYTCKVKYWELFSIHMVVEAVRRLSQVWNKDK